MAKTITRRIILKDANAKTLYEMFLNARQHSALTGGNTAKITPKEGTTFSVHNGYVTGKNLQLVKGCLIVQSWFGSDWSSDDPDSTFILLFNQSGKNAVMHMTHASIPDKHVESIRKGWTAYYWKPWKNYLASLHEGLT